MQPADVKKNLLKRRKLQGFSSVSLFKEGTKRIGKLKTGTFGPFVFAGMCQLLTQGTADIVLDSCSDYWDGTTLRTLTDLDRSVISLHVRFLIISPLKFTIVFLEAHTFLQIRK